MITRNRAINASASRRSKRQYYAFQFTVAAQSDCIENSDLIAGFGYIFDTAQKRKDWVNLSETDAAHGLLRVALTRDEARKAYKYGHFINWEDI